MQNKQLQLFLLPYAGGSIAALKRLTSCIDTRIECVPVEYPGRGTRAKEHLASSFNELLQDATQYCLYRRDEKLPFAVFGYSMGSILAYELIERRLIPGRLKHFFISAEVSPEDRAIELRKVRNPTDERILQRAMRLGGLDERLVTNKRFSDIYLKPMLSDYRLFFSYEYGEKREPVSTTTTVFYCEQDTAYTDVQKWEQLVSGPFDYHEMGNNHFFINQHAVEMASIMNLRLNQYLTGDEDDI